MLLKKGLEPAQCQIVEKVLKYVVSLLDIMGCLGSSHSLVLKLPMPTVLSSNSTPMPSLVCSTTSSRDSRIWLWSWTATTLLFALWFSRARRTSWALSSILSTVILAIVALISPSFILWVVLRMSALLCSAIRNRYKEGQIVHELNEQNVPCVIGGTQILNSTSFLEGINSLY